MRALGTFKKIINVRVGNSKVSEDERLEATCKNNVKTGYHSVSYRYSIQNIR